MAPAFILPFVVYLLGTNIAGRFSEGRYAVAYSVVAAVVAVTLIYLLRGKEILQVHARVGWGILFGLIGIGSWIFLCHLHLESYIAPYLPSFLSPGERVGFNPFEALGDGAMTWAFVGVRLVGIAILVPVAEELFWRGFLLRWLIDPEWEKIPLGEFTWQSCGIVVLMFTLAHPEWLAAAVYCFLINGLLYWKKDLWQCVVAHAVSNLVLALYVLQTGEWWLW